MSTSCSFNFPYPPYSIQIEFAQNLFNALSNKKFSIFESPTGTGKSLSLIMGSCKWLNENKENIDLLYNLSNDTMNDSLDQFKQKNDPSQLKMDCDLPDWLNDDFLVDHKKETIKIQIEKIKQNLKERKKEHEKIKKGVAFANISAINNFKQNKTKNRPNDENSEILDYESETETTETAEIHDLFNRLKNSSKLNNSPKKETVMNFVPLQIIYASRTHSQIKQFVQEIKKTEYGNLRVVTLGSRKILCINEQINHADTTVQKLNTMCKKIKNQASEKIKKCPYFQTTSDPNLSYLYLDQIQDIEEMKIQGKKIGICPYYGSKNNIDNAEIICVPYVSLFHKRTREKFGIKLKNSVIIVDEAHNLIESICQIHSFSLNFRQICQIFSNIKRYQDKYQKRLKAKNMFYLTQICVFLNKLRTFLQEKFNSNKPNTYISMKILDFLIEVNASSLDFMKLQAFIENSELSKKLNMFNEKHEMVETKNEKTIQKNDEFIVSNQNLLDLFIDFFIGLIKTNDKESCFLLKFSENLAESSLNILRLDAKSILNEILSDCHSMILAGGTMEPISEYNFIKEMIPQEKYFHFSCKHIISNNQFRAFVISSNKEDKMELFYNFQNKNCPYLLKNTIDLVEEVAKEVPDGLIVFVQSYNFLEILRDKLKNSKIESFSKKRIFFDSKNTANVIAEYEKEIKQLNKGAILFSVMGGKLSEGINFNDKLARGIMVFGLPFSNIKSPEIIEKTKFCEKKGINYQENSCMKLINQTIGRAIRHKNDYAVVYLVDKRFENPKIQEKLPSWIKEFIEKKYMFAEVISKTKTFFINMNKQNM